MPYEIANARCIHDTPKAIKVEAPDFDEPQWIPQWAIEDDSEVYKKGTEGVLVITESWAEKQGWL